MKRTNIMFTTDQHTILKTQAESEGKTIGELVRRAVDFVYSIKNDSEKRREIALNAYKEGLVSIGKLSEIFGEDLITIRQVLSDKGIRPMTQEPGDVQQDLLNA